MTKHLLEWDTFQLSAEKNMFHFFQEIDWQCNKIHNFEDDEVTLCLEEENEYPE